jgi:hypothetical protein
VPGIFLHIFWKCPPIFLVRDSFAAPLSGGPGRTPSAALATPLCVGQGTAEKRKKKQQHTQCLATESVSHRQRPFLLCSVTNILHSNILYRYIVEKGDKWRGPPPRLKMWGGGDKSCDVPLHLKKLRDMSPRPPPVDAHVGLYKHTNLPHYSIDYIKSRTQNKLSEGSHLVFKGLNCLEKINLQKINKNNPSKFIFTP